MGSASGFNTTNFTSRLAHARAAVAKPSTSSVSARSERPSPSMWSSRTWSPSGVVAVGCGIRRPTKAAGAQLKPSAEAWLGLVLHPAEIVADRWPQAECTEGQPCDGTREARWRPRDAPHAQRELNHLPEVILAFLLVGLQKIRPELAADHGGQLPGQTMGIANSAVHALTCERRIHMADGAR
jgi:hypothetical protein